MKCLIKVHRYPKLLPEDESCAPFITSKISPHKPVGVEQGVGQGGGVGSLRLKLNSLTCFCL